jgi:ADP-ribosylglycohydrolase
MAETPGIPDPSLPPRPLPATYWVVPGRFLVGEHPGSQSRAEAMDRLRRFLASGVTCFIDLTEPGELPSYESLLPAATPQGRNVRYLREPIRDHGVPTGPETVARVIAQIDEALGAGHLVYLHCRAGIGRSATVAGCWLAASSDAAADPLGKLQELWQQSARSRAWPVVPETQEQEDFVRDWSKRGGVRSGGATAATAALSVADRIRGALLGLALGDAMGMAASDGGEGAGVWSQHTALALCLAESLLERGVCDARDQMERYLRWQRDGYLSALGRPGQATPDVARALATYQWRGQPMAGSHDPKDRSTAGLPRVVSVAAFGAPDPAATVALAVECARTTHQSPLVLDACRYYAALLVGALRGDTPQDRPGRLYEPVSGLWAARPLRREIVAAVTAGGAALGFRHRPANADVVHAIGNVCVAVATARDVPQAIRSAIDMGCEPALDGALAGALAGALRGAMALPPTSVSALARLDLLEHVAARLAGRQATAEQSGARAQS